MSEVAPIGLSVAVPFATSDTDKGQWLNLCCRNDTGSTVLTAHDRAYLDPHVAPSQIVPTMRFLGGYRL
jgi:hypothetical protein